MGSNTRQSYDDAIKYMSVPSSIDGNLKQIPNTGAAVRFSICR